jgi:hypothetical protein
MAALAQPACSCARQTVSGMGGSAAAHLQSTMAVARSCITVRAEALREALEWYRADLCQV